MRACDTTCSVPLLTTRTTGLLHTWPLAAPLTPGSEHLCEKDHPTTWHFMSCSSLSYGCFHWNLLL